MSTASVKAPSFGGRMWAKKEAENRFRSLLALDMRDMRKISGCKYNQGLFDLIKDYKTNHPSLMKKQGSLRMREPVLQLRALGPLPSQDTDEETIRAYETLLAEISPPVSNDEARVLVTLFGPDDC